MAYDDAMTQLRGRVVPTVRTEVVPLKLALGRILAEDITAPRDVPAHDNSAVDGYAVFFDDLDGDTRLPVTGRIPAGYVLDRAAKRGEALRIFTGAPMPDGPDTVFMQEDVDVDGDYVTLPAGIKRGANRRKRAEDVHEGDVIVGQGAKLRPQEIGVIASVGHGSVTVYQRLKAAVFSTGDEVRDPGDDAPAGCIYDANRYTVTALLEGMGCAVTDLGILPDNLDTIQNALASAAKDHDLLITSGGVSVGDEDHVKPAVEALGSLHFWRLAIKPGRPIAFGQVGDAAFVGLPGNPVAAMVTFLRVAQPMVLTLMGQKNTDAKVFRVPATFALAKKLGRREWLRGRVVRGDDGILRAEKYPAEGSGILTSMVFANGLIELPEDLDTVAEGDAITFVPFDGILS